MNRNMPPSGKPNGVRKTANVASRKSVSSLRRLKQDYLMIMKDPIPYISVAPLPSDILEWHYVIHGPENSLYHGGVYHGKLKFPLEYPFKPPSIYMITPNGRFRTNTRLCLSFSDYHPDTWNPTWNLSTILTGLLSFMLEDHIAVGTVQSTDSTKRSFAKKSLEFNIKDSQFVELFPEITQEIQEKLGNLSECKSQSKQVNGGNTRSSERKSETAHETDRFIWSFLYNLLAIIAVIIFVFVVQWVVTDKSITPS